ncbi:ammonium transporter [Blastomonas marina]|uniref:Ammonium transporter n=1 Tax=Blastomonas marina TaxID=1867408 RepID=A0ABQ1F9U5_9SPHN|nr:ammonium transporter [Blastomonas marina]GGA04246.1 ammonium transporter [Blastomonas marina]
MRYLTAALAMGAALLPQVAIAQPVTAITVDVADSGDTAWILTASALVLMMAIPGLALFYGGLVRVKNAMSVYLQVGAIVAICSLLWVVVGYTLAFGEVGSGWIGDGSRWMMIRLDAWRADTTIPESSFALFQMTFFAITPALMAGAWVERARFGWVVAFCALWSLIVYAPVAHWIWGGGWLSDLGVYDFAGGLVVHTTAGISALVVALLLGRRNGFPAKPMLPHSPTLVMIGAALLWVGWFGFNGGSALTATDDASTAIINTHAAAATAALMWIAIEKVSFGKSTGIGFATGAIAGLATITPAAGAVAPGAAIIFGLLAAPVCYFAIRLIKHRFHIDDSLDVFAVHGVGGMLGTLLFAVFGLAAFGGTTEGVTFGDQFIAQLAGIAVVGGYSAVATALIALAVSLFLPMRVGEESERHGLDSASHGEHAFKLD